MASKAAVRSGAGYVSCACPESAQSALAGALTTVPTHPLPTSGGGAVAPDAALEAVDDLLEDADAALVGPGLGRAPQTERFVRRLVQTIDEPLVLDADGLNALAGQVDELASHVDDPWILTPHAGELRRLVGSPINLDDWVRAAQTYAERWGAVCLLKGTPSIVAEPDGRAYVSGIDTSALATAGTGDVLAGQCAGLLAQGMPPLEAVATALHIGGAAAERYEATHDSRSMAATDLLDMIPRVAADRFSPS
jgi:NAD(P)H-hydrate epimerase